MGVGLSWRASAAAVNGANLDVAAFSASLAARVSGRSVNVGVAGAGYLPSKPRPSMRWRQWRRR
ncbi:hypothetical protein [Mycobacterium sp. Marseille-P9652]|uniref:hypothetical protein n=1 Tax=Mycobacterium sp. Marseille-P9652 TaxID=2654950 RepID=UPI001E2C9F4C|nr:hypothetical protein [Mycobacterium sp. Marseille-P9652]